MAVIIPMAKMPNNCEECDLKGLCPDYWMKTREEYTRPSWCQLDDLDATTFCGVPMEEAVEIMQMYRRGELVHLAGRETKPTTEDCSTVEPQIFDKPTKCLGCLYSDLDKAFHPCASCVDFGKYVGEVSGKTEPQISPSDCKTCKHNPWSTPRTCGKCIRQEGGRPSMYEPEDEPQTETIKGLQLFADILFDKDKANQFLEECKTIGIEP